ncbi:hypothetical protein DRP77_12000 [Candidatus Poribacteria bacterium]|nr:MAG: hypothetical protein DRP77_12000 [Candidatus Poribacteria bacterium]
MWMSGSPGCSISGYEVKTPLGSFLLSVGSSRDLPDGERAVRRFLSVFENRFNLPRRYGLEAVVSKPPHRILFLDIETTGLSPRYPMFLVGLMYYDGEGFRFEQLLARNPSEEGAMLYHLRGLMEEFDLVVTFNGGSFDLPYIIGRMTRLGIDPPEGLREKNYDLLIYSRKKWRGTLPNCRLQTLEREICGRRRVGDIPSSMIPAAYREFLASGDPRIIRAIMFHNLLDLLTMAELIAALAEVDHL